MSDKTIFENIVQINTPESSSLEGYGYDYEKQILYIKYRTGSTVYAYPDVPLSRFNQFEKSESKGTEASMLRKEFKGMM